MPVLYLTINSEMTLDPANTTTENFNGKLDDTCWTIGKFLLGKHEFKIFHNEFFKGSQHVSGEDIKKYVVSGVVKMTVNPKIAELLLSGETDWTCTGVDVTQNMTKTNSLELAYLPNKSNNIIHVISTLDKPVK